MEEEEGLTANVAQQHMGGVENGEEWRGKMNEGRERKTDRKRDKRRATSILYVGGTPGLCSLARHTYIIRAGVAWIETKWRPGRAAEWEDTRTMLHRQEKPEAVERQFSGDRSAGAPDHETGKTGAASGVGRWET